MNAEGPYYSIGSHVTYRICLKKRSGRPPPIHSRADYSLPYWANSRGLGHMAK